MEPFGKAADYLRTSYSYVEYYNLVEPPFSLAPDTRFIYPSRSHSEALDLLLQALERRERIVMVTGEVGVGKTMLCRMLLQHLRPDTPLSQILDPSLDADDFLKQLLIDLRDLRGMSSEPAEVARKASRDELASAVRWALGMRLQLDDRVVIVVDEAQSLDVEVLEQIRLLTHLEAPAVKLQIILVGQPEFESLIRRAPLNQFDTEVSCRCTLRPLAEMEVGPYIGYRLSVARGGPTRPAREAGGDGVRFTPAAVRLIARLSRGIPRAINSLCDRSLEVGSERQQYLIGCKTALAAASRVPVPLPFMQPLERVRLLRGASFRLMLGTALVSSWASPQTKADPSEGRDTVSTAWSKVQRQPRARVDTVSTHHTDRRDIVFGTRLFGFKKSEVRGLMSKLIHEYEQALAEVEALRHELDNLDKVQRAQEDQRAQGVQSERSVEPTPQQSETAHQVERILVSAHRVADDIRKDAERDAGQLLTDAQQKVARMLEEAAAAAQEKTEAAAKRLRNVEWEIERMQACHRAVRSALEAAVTTIGATLADLSGFSILDAAQPPNEASADAVRIEEPERMQEKEAAAEV